MRLTMVTAVLAIVAMAGVFSSGHANAQSQSPSTQNNQEQTVAVQPGDSLDKIAQRSGTTYVRLFNANPNITDPDVIYPNQAVRIPAPDKQLPDRFTPPAAEAVPAPPVRSQAPAPATAPVSQSGSGIWNALAQCESGGNWATNTGNGYYGGLQFSLSSWKAVGGSGYPHEASAAEQIVRAEMLRAKQGWRAWPACSAKLGL